MGKKLFAIMCMSSTQSFDTQCCKRKMEPNKQAPIELSTVTEASASKPSERLLCIIREWHEGD
jgi:hypothetical protein